MQEMQTVASSVSVARCLSVSNAPSPGQSCCIDWGSVCSEDSLCYMGAGHDPLWWVEVDSVWHLPNWFGLLFISEWKRCLHVWRDMLGGASEVDRERWLDVAQTWSRLHDAADPRLASHAIHYPANVSFYIREQEDGHCCAGECAAHSSR